MSILEIIGLDQLGNDDAHFLTSEILILLILQHFNQFPLILMEDHIIEDKPIDGVIYLSE